VGFDADDPELIEQMKERILIDSHMEEAIATSQIEGAVTTRQRAKEMLRSGRRPRDRSEQMIVNGYRTIRLLRERAEEPLSVRMLHEIQQNMTEGTLEDPGHSGRFRSAGDEPVCVVDTRDDEVIFTPPPPKEIPNRIGRLIEFANEDAASESFMHPLVRAVVLHFWFAYEHPYCDGNGRTARALFYWYMLKRGYWLFEFLTISRIINASRMSYYRAFVHTEMDENDLTYFIVHQFDVTRRALDDLHARLREMTAQQQRLSAMRRVANLNVRQRALLDHALRHPNQVYTFESHQRSHGITYQTARTALLSLSHRGLMERLPTKKPMQFTPARDLRRKLGISPRARN
jgi:Fic family protein